MNAFMKIYKPWLYHIGAVTTLADGSTTVRAFRVQQAFHVMQAYNLFGLREHIPPILSQPVVVDAFARRLKMGLNGADKVLSICTDLAVSQLMVFCAMLTVPMTGGQKSG